MSGLLIALLVMGWIVAALGWFRAFRLQAECDRATQLGVVTQGLLLTEKGKPESMRRITGTPPQVYRRPHGRDGETRYDRVGLAAIYRPRTGT